MNQTVTGETPQKYGIADIKAVILFVISIYFFLSDVGKQKVSLIKKLWKAAPLLSDVPEVYQSLGNVVNEASELSPQEKEELNEAIAEKFRISQDKAGKVAELVIKGIINTLETIANIRRVIRGEGEDLSSVL